MAGATHLGQEDQVLLDPAHGRRQRLQPSQALVEDVQTVGRERFEGPDPEGEGVGLVPGCAVVGNGGDSQRMGGRQPRSDRIQATLQAVEAVGQAGQGPGAVLDAASQPGQ